MPRAQALGPRIEPLLFIILLFPSPPAILNPLLPAHGSGLFQTLTAPAGFANPPLVPDRQYWGTFYYPWYGNGELPPLTFTKDPDTTPLLGHTEPEVIRVDQTFYLYYRTDSSIAVANSSNGQNWNDLGKVLTTSSTGWDSGEVISPSVIAERGIYYLFYEADDKTRPGNRAIGLATSTSPTGPFTKHPNNPILDTGSASSWDSHTLQLHTIVLVGPRLWLYYS